MIRTPLLLVVAASAALAGCNNSSDHNIVAGGPADPMANELKNAPPVTLPPAITASKSYRCKDNSIVYIDWLNNGAARVKKSKDEAGTELAAGSSELKGSATDTTVTYKGQSCKA
ncbi:hypothetical protein HMF7854_05470 [Sphingomonas ginkgonis]|uniref:DUF4156 domain-containing protein n=1 Tax=Sphingomonas ginkgonis TaxID=2315330 RepID=A0A3R9YHZ5_9SPHN|nr:hypothetical protein [Sphingomonas ginkgonis]RST30333.1 hypothetical protein HMF7854_05470 [Sphingomonas ginkgonis]